MADGDPNAPGYRLPELTLPGGLDAARLDDRRGLMRAIDAARQRRPSRSLDDFDRFHREAFALLTGPEARRAFDLSREDPRLRDRYGRHQWGQSALMARRLVEAGVRFVTLTFGGWDFHSSLDKGMHSVLPVLDRAVGTLVEDLDQRGRLESTMVIVMGEFGRTPRINKGLPQDPVPGRDHWGKVMSVLLAGGGLTPGVVVGSVERPRRGPPRPPGDPRRPPGHALRPARPRPRGRLPRPGQSPDRDHPPRRPADPRAALTPPARPDSALGTTVSRQGPSPRSGGHFRIHRESLGGLVRDQKKARLPPREPGTARENDACS